MNQAVFDSIGDAGDECRAIVALLGSLERVAFFVHNSTDGDTLGSALAIALAVSGAGKQACVVIEEAIPDYLKMLPGQGLLKDLGELEEGEPARWDAIFVVDTGDTKLLGKRRKLLDGAACVVNIDHHHTNKRFGTINYIDTGSASTAEIAYMIIKAFGTPIDHDIAMCVYTGICTDTGGFSYGNTTSRAHFIAADLLRFGIDVAHLRYLFFDAITCGKLRCHGYTAQSLRFYYRSRLAVAVLSRDKLDAMHATDIDCDGLVDIGRNVIGVHVSALAREIRPGEFRINLRSRDGADVSEVAAQFGGGGHKAAAGCTIKADGSEVAGLLVRAMQRLWPDCDAGDGQECSEWSCNAPDCALRGAQCDAAC